MNRVSGQAGWYPDPGGQRGMFRYWNGSAWSHELSPDPGAPPPGRGAPAGPPPAQRGAFPGQQQPGQPQPGQPMPGRAPTAYPVQRPRSGVLWWVLGGGLILVLIIAGAFILPGLFGFREQPGLPGGPEPDIPTPTSVCPPFPSEAPTQAPQPNDGRVHAGNMSYPTLGSPWSSPAPDNRVPFGRDTQYQSVTIEANYDGMSSWVASVLIAELAAGDGFFSPEQGSEIVVNCIVGSFYGDAEVTRDDQVNEARTVDGRDAWLVESQLSFDIPNLKTKGERLIVLIVKTTDTTSALYYASIPDTSPELLEPARQTMEQLRVD
nr:DUF2510 domain-containing protein [Naumannella cuiyingiana]